MLGAQKSWILHSLLQNLDGYTKARKNYLLYTSWPPSHISLQNGCKGRARVCLSPSMALNTCKFSLHSYRKKLQVWKERRRASSDATLHSGRMQWPQKVVLYSTWIVAPAIGFHTYRFRAGIAARGTNNRRYVPKSMSLGRLRGSVL